MSIMSDKKTNEKHWRVISMKKTDSLELADLLRRAIITGEYKPRERLVEMELAQKYSVSRTWGW